MCVCVGGGMAGDVCVGWGIAGDVCVCVGGGGMAGDVCVCACMRLGQSVPTRFSAS